MFSRQTVPYIILALMISLSSTGIVGGETGEDGTFDEPPHAPMLPTRTIIEESESNNNWASADLIPATPNTTYELHGNLSPTNDFDFFYFTLTGGAGPVDRITIRPLWVDTDYTNQAFVAWIWSFYPTNSLSHSPSDEISSAVQIWDESTLYWGTLQFTASYSGIYGLIIRPASTLSGSLAYNFSVSVSSVTPVDPNNDRGSSMELTSLSQTVNSNLQTNTDQFDWFHFPAPNPIHPTKLDLTVSLSSTNPNYNDGIFDWGVEVDIFVYHNTRTSPQTFTTSKYRVSTMSNFQKNGCMASPASISITKNCTEMYVAFLIKAYGMDANGGISYNSYVGTAGYSANFNIIPQVPNKRPVLIDASASPARGRSSDMFTFSVKYIDYDNGSVQNVYMWKDGEFFRKLSPLYGGSNLDMSTGVVFGVELPGSVLGKDAVHSFNFSANDGIDRAVDTEEALSTLYVTVDDNQPPSPYYDIYEVEIKEDDPPQMIDLDQLFKDPDPSTTFSYSIDVGGEMMPSYTDSNLSAQILPAEVPTEPNYLKVTMKPDVFGTFHIRVNATDSGVFRKSAELDIVMQVSPVNDPPVIKRVGGRGVDENDESKTLLPERQGDRVELEVMAEDVDPGDVLRYVWNFQEALSNPVEGENFHMNLTSGEAWIIPDDSDVPEIRLLLRVEDDNGGSDELEVILPVENVNDPPSITVPSERSTVEGEYLYITPTVTDPDLDNGDQLIFGYDLGDLAKVAPPGSIDFDPTTGRMVIKASSEEMNGEWTINITVTDLELLSDFGICRVTIQNINDPPVANIIDAQVEEGNLTVVFITQEAEDEDGDELTYLWDFGDGSSVLQGKDLKVVEHQYSHGGSYTVTMKVFDGEAYSEEMTTLISVSEPEPDEDQDSDGMLDRWELAYGLDPTNPDDALEDADGDGLTNLEEFQLSMDRGWALNPRNPDSDMDGYDDGTEFKNGFDPLDPGSHPEPKYGNVPLIMYIFAAVIIALALLFSILAVILRRRNRPTAVAAAAQPVYDQAPYQLPDTGMVPPDMTVAPMPEMEQLPPAEGEGQPPQTGDEGYPMAGGVPSAYPTAEGTAGPDYTSTAGSAHQDDIYRDIYGSGSAATDETISPPPEPSPEQELSQEIAPPTMEEETPGEAPPESAPVTEMNGQPSEEAPPPENVGTEEETSKPLPPPPELPDP